MIQSADEFQIVKNVLQHTRGIKSHMNWKKVQEILLAGTSNSCFTISCIKARELGVDPCSYKWEKVGEVEE